MNDLTIHAGSIVHVTRIGPITADRELSPSVVAALVAEFERQGITPSMACRATPVTGESGRFHFERVQAAS